MKNMTNILNDLELFGLQTYNALFFKIKITNNFSLFRKRKSNIIITNEKLTCKYLHLIRKIKMYIDICHLTTHFLLVNFSFLLSTINFFDEDEFEIDQDSIMIL